MRGGYQVQGGWARHAAGSLPYLSLNFLPHAQQLQALHLLPIPSILLASRCSRTNTSRRGGVRHAGSACTWLPPVQQQLPLLAPQQPAHLAPDRATAIPPLPLQQPAHHPTWLPAAQQLLLLPPRQRPLPAAHAVQQVHQPLKGLQRQQLPASCHVRHGCHGACRGGSGVVAHQRGFSSTSEGVQGSLHIQAGTFISASIPTGGSCLPMHLLAG